jgi:hypothetical protein
VGGSYYFKREGLTKQLPDCCPVRLEAYSLLSSVVAVEKEHNDYNMTSIKHMILTTHKTNTKKGRENGMYYITLYHIYLLGDRNSFLQLGAHLHLHFA